MVFHKADVVKDLLLLPGFTNHLLFYFIARKHGNNRLIGKEVAFGIRALCALLILSSMLHEREVDDVVTFSIFRFEYSKSEYCLCVLSLPGRQVLLPCYPVAVATVSVVLMLLALPSLFCQFARQRHPICPTQLLFNLSKLLFVALSKVSELV